MSTDKRRDEWMRRNKKQEAETRDEDRDSNDSGDLVINNKDDDIVTIVVSSNPCLLTSLMPGQDQCITGVKSTGTEGIKQFISPVSDNNTQEALLLSTGKRNATNGNVSG